MTQSGPRSGQPAQEEAPPREPLSRVHRSGYLMLAVSGVVLATAFGGVAQFLTPHAPTTDIPAGNRNPGSNQVIPADEYPGTLPATSGGESKRTSPSPSTTVTVGPDGQRTVAVVPSAGSAPIPIASVPQDGGPVPPPTSGSPKPPSSNKPPSSPPSSTSTSSSATTSTSTTGSGGGTATSH